MSFEIVFLKNDSFLLVDNKESQIFILVYIKNNKLSTSCETVLVSWRLLQANQKSGSLFGSGCLLNVKIKSQFLLLNPYIIIYNINILHSVAILAE